MPVQTLSPSQTADITQFSPFYHFANYSVFNNPYFFKGVVAFVVTHAIYGFESHVFSNKSAERPNGYLSRSTFKSFFGVTGDDDDLQFMPGHEQIPEN